MFDRIFFERQFPDHVQQFCREQKLAAPVVELLLDDGTVLRLRAINQTRESWLSVTVHGERAEARLIFCPYFTIKRITFGSPSSPKDGTFALAAAP
ncbi:MAG: hypothetical protein HY726_16430 [Candidatus Rokubacteria bacterium]|nr:hypothetical protein [Candidatus Rokubacteria bacterium]